MCLCCTIIGIFVYKQGQEFGPYRDIGSTLGTVAILFTGEGDYEGQFNSGGVSFPFASYFLYFLFVIMVGILFNNLLVGCLKNPLSIKPPFNLLQVSLAVGEVDDLQTNAKLEEHRLNASYCLNSLIVFSLIVYIQVEGIIDGLEIFFPFISAKEPVVFKRSEGIDKYLKAESEWKKAQEQNDAFADSVLKVCTRSNALHRNVCVYNYLTIQATTDEMIQSKIDELKVVLNEKTKALQNQIQQLADRIIAPQPQ